MITSMTGFGRAEIQKNGFSISVEIKSVNNRYCDISVYLPNNLKILETLVRQTVQSGVERGKITVSVNVEYENEADLGIEANEKVLNSYLHLFNDVKRIAGINQEITLEHLFNFKEIFATKDIDETVISRVEEVLMIALNKALTEFCTIRKQEGTHLAEDFLMRINQIVEHLKKVENRAKERVPEARAKFYDRIKALLDDDQYDRERLELEIAIMADKLDITEEIVRLESHLKLFREAINGNETVGRRLNFLSQEMNREINTMGSKANDSEIAHQVVFMKETLENIREQIMNVE